MFYKRSDAAAAAAAASQLVLSERGCVVVRDSAWSLQAEQANVRVRVGQVPPDI